MVPWSHLRQPSLGWVMTVLTAELTHFKLVIRLSKVQQLAFPFCTAFWVSRWSLRSLVKPRGIHLCDCEAVLNIQKPPFLQQCHSDTASCHDKGTRQAHDFQVWSSFFWWLSGEVKHIVHLIRWNLKAVICPCGWLEHGPGLAQRTTFRFRNWILFLINCFGFPVCHQLVPHLVPNFPACLSVMCRGV